jgi:hypothetical protein
MSFLSYCTHWVKPAMGRSCNVTKPLWSFLVLSLMQAAFAHGEDCGVPGDQPGRYGPFDYRDRARLKSELSVVEVHHFTAYMEETALYGFSSRPAVVIEEQRGGRELIAGNFDYTLYAFPNHYPALHAMGVWQLRLREAGASIEEVQRTWGVRSAECYFERAILMAPDDGMTYLAYGVFLHKAKQADEAQKKYARAIELMPDSPEAAYNLGLLYFDLADYDKAAALAARAYELGYPLQGLRRKLERVGVDASHGNQ